LLSSLSQHFLRLSRSKKKILISLLPKNFFDAWNIFPKVGEIEKWDQVDEVKISKFENKLLSLQASEYVFDMTLELAATSSGKPYFRITDTALMPFSL
jgi:hypothetical protein